MEAALRRRARLVVAGTHSYGRASRVLLGHNDWQLTRLCPVPLLLVKSATAYRAPRILAAIDPGHAHDKPAQLDDEILILARRWADALRGTVHAVHACLPPTPMRVGRFGGDIPQDVLDAHRYAARAAFDALCDRAEVPPRCRHFVDGRAPDVLPALARRLRAQLAVLGCVSRGRLERALIGSTAERVVDRLDCDLLVVKPRAFRPPATEIGDASGLRRPAPEAARASPAQAGAVSRGAGAGAVTRCASLPLR